MLGDLAPGDLAPGQYFVTMQLGKGWLARGVSFAADRHRAEPVGPLNYMQIQSAKLTWADEYRVEIREE